MRPHNTHTLKNGLKIIHEVSPTDVVYCGYLVKVGTRSEDELDLGMAHFCEHMTFKGTAKRSSMKILNELELVGGDLNAYTNKEETVYYAAVLKEDFIKASRLLTDIVFHSIYPQAEIDKEVEVIIDEIDSYKDSPSELIFDEFEEMIFRGHPLGRNILGSPERLRQYKTEDALRFTKQHYVPSNATFFVFGDVDFDKLVNTIDKLTSDIPFTQYESANHYLPEYMPETKIINKKTHQSHVLIGTRTFAANDKRRMSLFLLNNILGGPGMNSWLNVSLREKSGLVYTVESNLAWYGDTGSWNVYFGCDENDYSRCRKLLLKELGKLCNNALTPSQLEKAKKQIKGQIGISCDNFENYALSMAKVFAHFGTCRDIDRVYQQIDELTADELLSTAQTIFKPEGLTTLVYK